MVSCALTRRKLCNSLANEKQWIVAVLLEHLDCRQRIIAQFIDCGIDGWKGLRYIEIDAVFICERKGLSILQQT